MESTDGTSLLIKQSRKQLTSFPFFLQKKDGHTQSIACPGPKPTHQTESKTLTEGHDTSLPSESEDSNPDDENTKVVSFENRCTDVNEPVNSLETSDRNEKQNSEDTDDIDATSQVPLKNMRKRKILKDGKDLIREQDPNVADKRQKKSSVSDIPLINPNSTSECKYPDFEAPMPIQHEKVVVLSAENPTGKEICVDSSSNTLEQITKDSSIFTAVKTSASRNQTAHGWNKMERDLYLKGIEIFGENWYSIKSFFCLTMLSNCIVFTYFNKINYVKRVFHQIIPMQYLCLALVSFAWF